MFCSRYGGVSVQFRGVRGTGSGLTEDQWYLAPLHTRLSVVLNQVCYLSSCSGSFGSKMSCLFFVLSNDILYIYIPTTISMKS